MSDKVREAFEAWARAEVLPDDCSHIEWDGCEAWCYCLATSSRIELTDEWTVWQASRRGALEEAVKVFDAEAPACKYGARRVAKILRALAQGGAA